jgi:hypothetical protein
MTMTEDTDALDLAVGIEFGLFGEGDTGNDEFPERELFGCDNPEHNPECTCGYKNEDEWK